MIISLKVPFFISFQQKDIFIIASQGSNHLFQDRKEGICLFSQLLCTLKGSQRAVILMLGKRVKEFLEGFSSNFLPFWGNKVFWINSYMNVMDMLIAKCIFSE